MSRLKHPIACTALLLIVLASCTGTGSEDASSTSVAGERGGILRLGAIEDSVSALDPQKQQDQFPYFLYQCCLLRMLVYVIPPPSGEPGGPTIEGDIAARAPEVSADGLTYTFSLREGVRFAPPVDRDVVAQDFITAFERALAPETLSFDSDLFSVIEGAQEYIDGKANSIVGLSTPNDRTLEIQLSEPSPLFVTRLQSPTTAPIPAELSDGHEKDYGRFLAATGPYMIEGSEDIDLSVSSEDRDPASGYVPGQSLTIVRNPSWDPSTDPLRGEAAFVDGMEITIGGSAADYAQKIELGELDIQVDATHPATMLQKYATDPALEDRIVTHTSAATAYVSMTVAEPPFDDPHVRRAVNWIVDRGALARVLGGSLNAVPACHYFPDETIGGVLADFCPFATTDGAGDLEQAKEEMRQSAYDSDQDGICDAQVCSDVLAVATSESPGSDQAQIVEANLSEIGITLDLKSSENRFAILDEPSNRVALNASPAAWGSDLFDPTGIAGPVFASKFIGPKACCNEVLLGASPQQLQDWGYPTTSVPSVDQDIADCDAMEVGPDRTQCWATLDQTLTAELAPWVPVYFEVRTRILSDRVVSAPWSDVFGFIALDEVVLGS